MENDMGVEIAKEKVTLLYNGVSASQSIYYYFFTFSVPYKAESLELSIFRETENETQLPVALFDPSGRPRLLKASEGAKGEYKEVHYLALSNSSKGGLDGEIEKGEWKLVIFKRRFNENINLEFSIKLGSKCKEVKKLDIFSFQDKVIKKESTWYSGELHTHSNHSTGRTDTETIVKVAKEEGLDFLAITDHFTLSHLADLKELQDKYNILLFSSVEISGQRGHANLHGVRNPINPFVDEAEFLSKSLNLKKTESMETLADYIHSTGGLFSINHSESGLVGWRYHEFPLKKADLFEAWCVAERETTFIYPYIWASYLVQGYHLTAVGSSDSHDPTSNSFWKVGRIRNWVKCNELSEQEVMKNLKKGTSYIALGKSKLEFKALYKNKEYEMGDTIHLESAKLKVQIILFDVPDGNLFIYVANQIHDVKYVTQSHKVEFTILLSERDFFYLPNGESYIRVEFYEELEKAKYFAMAYRDYRSMRILSNPIWVEKNEN